MPTLRQQDGFSVVLYFNDHVPAHVHVFNADGEARVSLLDLAVLSAVGMKRKDLNKARAIVAEHRDFLLSKWKEVHG